MATTMQKERHIQDAVSATGELTSALEKLNALQTEYDSMDFVTDLSDGDFKGNYAGMTKQNVVDLYTTLNAINALLNADGLLATLYRVK